MERSRHFEGLLIIGALIAIGAYYLWQNSQPAIVVSIPAATVTPLDVPPPEWQAAIEAELALASTLQPTPDLQVTAYTPPTLPSPEVTIEIVQPLAVPQTPWPTPTLAPTEEPRPTVPGPTSFPSPTGIYVAQSNEELGFAPPPEQVPLSPHVNDHFWMLRPVDVRANSESLYHYPFGSSGIRIHHGVDIANPVGKPIQAAGAGTVIWAEDATGGAGMDQDIYSSYGNVVVIEHDFGFRGQRIWTLYAHMSAIIVEEGQHVEAGEVLGLVGATGDVSGPHVHMEVRIGQNSYFTVHNPLLWIAPYIGSGVVAGRVSYADGSLAEDAVVTLTRNGRIIERTTTYVAAWVPGLRTWHVVPDPAWQENFVIGDVTEGDYLISVTIFGRRVEREISVRAGTTNFVTLGFEPAATPQPVVEGE